MKLMKKAMILSFMAAVYVLLMACGEATGPVATSGPSVSTASPAAAASDVGTGSAISITFSEAMNTGTVTASNLYLVQGSDCAATAVAAGAISQTGNTYAFSPSAQLAVSQQYTTCVKTGVQNSAGTALAAQYSASWTTNAVPEVPGVPSVPGTGK